MPTYEFVTVDVFTDRRFGGNPLAVFPDARGLTDEQMQALALEFNLSETTFVLPPDNPQHHAKVRIFTPRAELPFAGHPNVGTGYVLARRDDKPPEHYVFEELAGLVRVHVLRLGRTIVGARISAPRALSIDIGEFLRKSSQLARVWRNRISLQTHIRRWSPRWGRHSSLPKLRAWRRCRAPVRISVRSARRPKGFPRSRRGFRCCSMRGGMAMRRG